MLEGLLHVAIVSAVIMLSIAIHYEFLDRLNRAMIRIDAKPRARIIGGVAAAIIAHSAEISVFAAGYYIFAELLGHGALTGNFNGSLADYMYFSYSTFTTVGFGDIAPTGAVRWLVGIESLTGFVLITWTASFLYLEMSRFWVSR